MQKQKRSRSICMAYHEIMRNRPNAVISYQQLKYKVWFMQWNPHNLSDFSKFQNISVAIKRTNPLLVVFLLILITSKIQR